MKRGFLTCFAAVMAVLLAGSANDSLAESPEAVTNREKTAADASQDPGLVGYWKLKGDCRDYSGRGNHGVNHGVQLDGGEFDGVSAYVEVPTNESLQLGTGDFSLSAWVHTAKQLDDIVGDVFEMYDPQRRREITLSINSTAGGFQSQGPIATFTLASTTPGKASGRIAAGRVKRATTSVNR